MDQAKGRSQKLLLLVLYVHTSNCIAYSPTGLRVHNRIGIARLVGFCDAASRLSMASGTAGRSRLVLACLSLVEDCELGYDITGFFFTTATLSMYKKHLYRYTVISSPIIHPPFPMFPIFRFPSSPHQTFTLWLNPPIPPSSPPPTLLIPSSPIHQLLRF